MGLDLSQILTKKVFSCLNSKGATNKCNKQKHPKYENAKWKFFESVDTFKMQRGSKKNIGRQSDLNVTIQNNLSGFDFFFNGTKMIDGLSNNGRIVQLAFEKKIFLSFVPTFLPFWTDEVKILSTYWLSFLSVYASVLNVYLYVMSTYLYTCVKFVLNLLFWLVKPFKKINRVS